MNRKKAPFQAPFPLYLLYINIVELIFNVLSLQKRQAIV